MSNARTTRPPIVKARKQSHDPVLDTMDLTPKAMPEDGDLGAAVLMAAMEWPVRIIGDHLVCNKCGQGVLAMSQNGHGYHLTLAHVSMTIVAHMIQRHKWTREGPPNE